MIYHLQWITDEKQRFKTTSDDARVEYIIYGYIKEWKYITTNRASNIKYYYMLCTHFVDLKFMARKGKTLKIRVY